VVFTDGMSTLSTVVVLFAKDNIGLTSGQISLMHLLALASGILGAFILPKIQQALQIQLVSMLQFSLFVCGLVCAWSIVGFLGLGFGFVTKEEMMYIPIIYGFFLSYVRVMNITLPSYMMPEGKETEIFSLLQVFEDGTSFLGPLITSFCTQVVDGRFAMFMITPLIWMPIIGLSWVDVEKGRAEAGRPLSVKAVQLAGGTE